jgi:endonuclease/exonuclease/phosphatase family metal-dependent hydrolase
MSSVARAALFLVVVLSCTANARAQEARQQELFTYEELIQLSEQEPLAEPLAQKLQRLQTTPFVKNDAAGRNSGPLKPSTPRLGRFLRIASWNIERGLEYEAVRAALSGPEEFARVLDQTKFPSGSQQRAAILEQAEHLRQADVIVLNEVDWGMKRTEYRNVAAELASALGMNYAWGVEFVEVDPTLLGTEKFENAPPEHRAALVERIQVDTKRYLGLHGSAILSRYRLENVRLVPLKAQGYDWYASEKAGAPKLEKLIDKAGEKFFHEKSVRQMRRGGRMMLVADISDPDISGGKLTVVGTHLEDNTKPGNRRRQIEEVLAQIKDVANPVVVAGDMNTSTTDRTPKSFGRVLKKKFGNVGFWVNESIGYATGYGLVLGAAEFIVGTERLYNDPTVHSVPFFSENHEVHFFESLKNFRFADGGAFDFRGERDRSYNNREKTLANSNERASKGFVETSELAHPVGPFGRFKLDWIFVKLPGSNTPNVKKQPYRFAPHLGRTLAELNKASAKRISDHNPITVDLPFDDPGATRAPKSRSSRRKTR